MAKGSGGGSTPSRAASSSGSGDKGAYNSIHKERIRAYAAGHGVGFSTKKTKKGSGTLFVLTSRGRRFTTTSASMAIEFIEKTGRNF